MNDLERELRSALDREAGDAPAPHDAGAALSRTRRRQVGMIAGSVIAATALIAIAVLGFGALNDESVEIVPASTTEELNGITITFPDRWTLIDPDVAGLNGPIAGDPQSMPQLPRLVLALAPFDPGELFGCPGMAEGAGDTFLMTVQEMPLALSGDAARPWAVELEPLDVGTAESGCYPGWEFLRAGWTAERRTFEARVGFGPGVTDADRDALFAAFASMSFEPAGDAPTSVVLETGEIGGETWELIASRELDGEGLFLSLQTEDQGSGTGGFSPNSITLQFAEVVVGSGNDARNVVFGAVPPGTAGIDCPAAAAVRTFDVPDDIDDRFEAFIVELDVGREAELNAVDADGNVVASGRAGLRGGPNEPVETPSMPVASDLEDGRHFGYVRAVDVDAGTISFDLAYLLTGDEADRAYQEATGETGHVPNDYYVVNDNPKLRTLTLAPEVLVRLLDWNDCCVTFFDAELDVWAEVIARQDFVEDRDIVDDHGHRYSPNAAQVWITVQDGVVTHVEEQYTP
jgi:hypothetical protein